MQRKILFFNHLFVPLQPKTEKQLQNLSISRIDMKQEGLFENIKNTSSGYAKLDEWVTIWRQTLPKYFGYPFNEVSPLRDFYEWYYR